jgi:hypothetical protein
MICRKPGESEERLSRTKSTSRQREPFMIDVRVPTETQILWNPRRRKFLGGGWIDSSEPDVISVYWHRRQALFTVHSLLQVLEHETLHAVLIRLMSLQTSMKLDNVHRSSHAWISPDKLIFINQFRFKRWTTPPYFEEPTSDLIE